MTIKDFVGVLCLGVISLLAPVGIGLVVGIVCRLTYLGWRIAWGTA